MQNKKWCKTYRSNHDTEIKIRKNERLTCECGKLYKRDDKARHEKTKFHLNIICK